MRDVLRSKRGQHHLRRAYGHGYRRAVAIVLITYLFEQGHACRARPTP